MLLLGSALSAQSPPNTPTSPAATGAAVANRGWFRPFVQHERAIWTSPLRLKKHDARWLVPFALTTGALIASDASIAGALPDTPRQIDTGQALSRIGASYTVAGLAGGMYLAGRFAGNTRARETGRIGAEALVHSLIVTHALKFATGRQRPEEGDGRGDFFKRRVSFPSGHAMAAWSLAAVVAHEYRDRKAVRYGAFAAALATSAGRMMARKHFASDCLVGGVLGYSIGAFLYQQGQREKNPTRGVTTRVPDIVPQLDRASRTVGVSLVWQF